MFNKSGFNKVWLILIVPFFLMVVIIGGSYYWFKSLSPEKMLGFLQSDLIKNQIKPADRGLFDYVPQFLGFTKPMTYLVLFENNTELRPGGGFIGVYAIIKMDKGKMNLVQLDGTENLDRDKPSTWCPTPLPVIKTNLVVNCWFFRDSNWSPDFSESAKKALEYYQGEGGIEANNIDGVIGFTPTVLEELLKITGPLTVDNVQFDASNVTEKLEYEVERAYDAKGIEKHDRKQIIKPLLQALLGKLNIFFDFNKYIKLTEDLIKEKQLMFYFSNEKLQKEIVQHDWTGEVKTSSTDYLLWVDANLSALKTDRVMERNLNYSIIQDTQGKYLATVEMNYKNIGKFDWRTTRYRTYARIFVPLGSELIKAEGNMKTDRSSEPGTVDQGTELGKTWFGTFTAIEPGQTKTLKFSYYLATSTVAAIQTGNYNLMVQKELGTLSTGLTLNLNFGKNISTTKPAVIQEIGSQRYNYSTDLSVDRMFEIRF